jgi:hypothetical protein
MYSIKWTKIINNNNKFLEYLCISLSINKKKADKTFEYPLFDTLSKGSAPPSTMNNVYFPELEKLARKLNKAFEKKGTKYLLKKQKELNDNTIQISIALLNGTIHLTYTKPIVEEK